MRRFGSPHAVALLSASAGMLYAAVAPAQTPPCADWAQLVSAQGVIEARRADATEWRPARLNDYLCPGDTLRAQRRARGALLLHGETLIRIDQHTALTLLPSREPGRRWIDLLYGVAHFISRVSRSLDVKTPYVNAAVEGTEFLLRIGADQTLLAVYEGVVRASNDAGEARVTTGETITAAPGRAPSPYALVRPRDAVQWALYYPPLVYYRPEQLEDQPAMQRARDAERRGDIDAAVEALAGADDARLLTYRAALQLGVGRADAARADLERALARAPDAGEARALLSMMAAVSDDRDRALRLAQESVSAAPQSPIALLALSYASQAIFNLEAARDAAERAARQDPANAIAWARLAELHLSMGDTERALAAASEASAREPNLARAQSVLGFAYLAQFKTGDARHAFETAIALDSSDPLPRLGLGLVKIREGELADGRLQIEIAASLDPGNALLRSYLGKAYYEEKRAPLAGDQLDMAKQLDPKDPTPWLYDAIRKQSTNRPVAALHDIQESIARNDNRAVYRSRLLLDQDAAARGANLARIYGDLGFEQLALREGTKSLSYDPADHSAHRFLADTYLRLRRHEIARASEALQSQLLQPLNINPIPTTLAETNLNLLAGTGPAGGLNEFSPLFERDRFAVLFTGVAGTNGTRGDESVFAGMQDKIAYSVNQFHYETNGFRPNNDLKQDIYSAFFQTALSHKSSLQLEWRSREQENGDLAMRFDPNNFSSALRQIRAEDTVRLGYHLAPSQNSDLIISTIYRDTDSMRKDARVISPSGPFGPVTFTEDRRSDIQGYNTEAQWLSRVGEQRYVFGAGYYEDENTVNPGVRITSGPLLLTSDTATSSTKQEHANAYSYTHFNLGPAVVMALGLSVDALKIGSFETDQINPKLGLNWSATPDTLVRFAAFRALKRSLVSNQTIEPTQIIGFNQFFDDFAATDFTRIGVALDQKAAKNLFLGIEMSERELDVPFFSGDVVTRRENQDEILNRAYVYWIPHPMMAVGAEYHYEAFERERTATVVVNQPLELTTRRLPLTVRYFRPTGFFTTLAITPFRQSIEQPVAGGGVTRDHESFWVTDIAVGYRLLKWQAILSLEVKNLFDEEFRFYDVDFQSGLPRESSVQPDRLVLFKLTLPWN